MKRWTTIFTVFMALMVGMAMNLPVGQAESGQEITAIYVLEAVKAMRTVYAAAVLEKVKQDGVMPKENWAKEDHAIMLPAQFVKAVGREVRNFEVGLLGIHPLYKTNAPQTGREKEMLDLLAKGNKKVVTFSDGKQFKGMSADFAILQGCADCHNQHANTTKKDWKIGDFMGAIIFRMEDQNF